jgi:putative membrane protein
MTGVWSALFSSVFIWSAIAPKDYFTWLLEVSPALIAVVLLWVTRKRFPFTTLSYWLILLHAIILMIGGHYTYAEVPMFDWLKETFALQRNNYDKVGHFVQGFVPAIIAREILIRNAVINGRNWLIFIVLCIVLAISAFYELIEWWVAELTGEGATAFLGTQGYVWDTQSDMALALSGAILALAFISRQHDRQLRRFMPLAA